MTDAELEQDYKEMQEAFRKENETMTREKAEKRLTELGIMHLLVPMKKYRFRPRKTSRAKRAARLKAVSR